MGDHITKHILSSPGVILFIGLNMGLLVQGAMLPWLLYKGRTVKKMYAARPWYTTCRGVRARQGTKMDGPVRPS